MSTLFLPSTRPSCWLFFLITPLRRGEAASPVASRVLVAKRCLCANLYMLTCATYADVMIIINFRYSDVQGIVDVTVVGDDVYVLHSNQEARNAAARAGRSSPVDAPVLQYHCEHMSLLTPGELVGHMLDNERVIDAAEMILEYRQNASLDCFLEHVEASVLTLLRHKLSEEPGEMAAHLEVRMTELAMEAATERVERENRKAQQSEASAQMFNAALSKTPAGKAMVVDGTATAAASGSPEPTSLPGAGTGTQRALVLGQ